MVRSVVGVVAGLVVWVALATVAGVILRNAWPAYASVADAMTFTLPMMIARLSIGAVATLAAGWVATVITRRFRLSLLPGVVLLLGFIPQHIMLWEKFPVSYHLTFLCSLLPLTLLGGRMAELPEGSRT